MKKKATKQTDGENADESKGKRREFQSDMLKGAIDKKQSMQFKDRVIAEKRDKKLKRTERKNNTEVPSIAKKDQEKNQEHDKDQEAKQPVEEKTHFRKNQLKKTRSKQKNKKKDNRSLEEKRHKLL